MSNYRVARRYATALLESAEEEHRLDETAKDVELIENTLRQNRELRLVLGNPVVQKEKKRQILRDLFEKKAGPLTLKFLDLLTEKDREGDLLEILVQFSHLLDEKRGIVRVEVTSAVPLTDEQGNLLKKKLEFYTGRKVIPRFHLDPKVLGGFVVRLEDRVIDASIAHQIDLLREKFLEGAHTGRES
jgi:F-type H+-transporting ATPase subunit delta